MAARLATGALAAATLAVAAGCGRGSAKPPPAFAWLHPAAPPRSWTRARLADGSATLAFPADWRRIRSDPGTVTAALRARSGRILGYLNATPQQGAETLADWHRFRVDHNGEEGDRRIRQASSATGLGFLDATGSCVIDDYSTKTRRAYREIACIVRGARATNVIVGAAPPSRWREAAPAIERAISAFKT